MTRQINMAGLDLIERVEGLRLAAYLDTGNVPTIGYGHTHNVKMGDTCTQHEATLWLNSDLADAEKAVEHLVDVPLNDNQFAALVSFAFNVGFVLFAKSSLLHKLNGGKYDMVPASMKAWVFDNGKVIEGLKTRRVMEGALWNRPC